MAYALAYTIITYTIGIPLRILFVYYSYIIQWYTQAAHAIAYTIGYTIAHTMTHTMTHTNAHVNTYTIGYVMGLSV